MSQPTAKAAKEFWLFGYGSLIWKPPPHYDLSLRGFIMGYVRRFWQASEDHRGTPASPGRVVTLIERSYWEKLGEKARTSEPDKVYGAAYRIPGEHVDEVKKYLDIREVNGYSIHYTTFFPAGSTSTSSAPAKGNDNSSESPTNNLMEPISDCLVYIGLPNNPQFLGLQHPDAIAEVIARSEGPSGRNDEYLFMLEKALKTLYADNKMGDPHISDLARRLRKLNEGNNVLNEDAAGKDEGHSGRGW